jgi:hypothetical protein
MQQQEITRVVKFLLREPTAGFAYHQNTSSIERRTHRSSGRERQNVAVGSIATEMELQRYFRFHADSGPRTNIAGCLKGHEETFVKARAQHVERGSETVCGMALESAEQT